MIYHQCKKKVFYSIIFLFLFCVSAKGQTTTYNFDTSDIIIIKSPSKNYKDILLQNHNDLPRFGVLNRYMISRGKIEPNSREKSKLIRESYSSYMGLIQMDYMKAMYNDFNREVFTYASNSNMSKKEQNSVIAQKHFQELSQTVCTKEAGNINGGTNEFERRRNYKNFVANNLDGLRKWSSTLLKNNSVTGYWVNTTLLKDYDFDKKGYWLHIPLATRPQRNSSNSFFLNFTPKTSYENKLPIKRNRFKTVQPIKVLFKISPEDAEKLNPKQESNVRKVITATTLFMVAKIKVTLNEFSENKNMGRPEVPNFEHHFTSPIITLYKDAALTEKVGEISLENFITEN